MLKTLVVMVLSIIFITSPSLILGGTFYAVPALTYQNFFNKDNDLDLVYRAVTARLTVGYGDLFNQYIYLAGEIFANPKSVKVHDQSIGDFSLEPKYSYGASLLPGMLVDSMTKIYIKLGVIYTNFEKLDSTAHAYQVGAGLDFELTPCWLVRGEYAYNKYDSISGVSSIRADEVSLGLIYLPEFHF